MDTKFLLSLIAILSISLFYFSTTNKTKDENLPLNKEISTQTEKTNSKENALTDEQLNRTKKTENILSQKNKSLNNDKKSESKVNEYSTTSKLISSINQLNLPKDANIISENKLKQTEAKIADFFENETIVNKLNDNELSDSEREKVSELLTYVTTIRGRLIRKNEEKIKKEIDAFKQAMANGEIEQPRPLTQEQKLHIEEKAELAYQEKIKQLRHQRAQEDRQDALEDALYQ